MNSFGATLKALLSDDNLPKVKIKKFHLSYLVLSMLNKPMMFESLNVLGEPLIPCSFEPKTGFFRDGCCNTSHEDQGMHTVCIEADAEFLAFSRKAGNDLSTPNPAFGFAGLKPGDKWCLCAPRWVEAYHAGAAPKVILESTHEETLAIIPLKLLKEFQIQ